MNKLRFIMTLALLPLSATSAFAASITITVTPWLAPNNFGSPSATQANANAANGLYKGQTTYGSAGPTQFNAQPNITSAQGVVTGFPSWMGVAEPGGAYASELGNRLTFAVAIYGNGTQFSISQLSASLSSTDPANSFSGVVRPTGYFQYGQTSYGGAGGLSDYIGVLAGLDGKVGTSDDTFVTGGSNTQLVDALFGSGTGASFAAYCPGCTAAQEQDAINTVASYPGSPYTVTGTYRLADASGSGTFNVTPFDAAPATPEPSSLLLFGTGILGVVGAARRRITQK